MRKLISLCSLLLINSFSNAQIDSLATLNNEPVKVARDPYKLRLAADIPIIVVCAGWSAYAFPQIYSKDFSTEEQIMALDRKNIPGIDRWAAGKSDKAADNASDYFLYGSIPVPFALLLDKSVRGDAGKIGLMYLEAFSITGFFYSGSCYFVDRYRPETYDTDIPVKDRLSGNYKDAFLGGHPATVATATFFAAKVYSDYHPGSNWNYVFYGGAIAATGTTVYLRHIAGKHFPTDLLAGVALGTMSGILVPEFHKRKGNKESKLGLMPYTNGKMHGIFLTYNLK